MSALTVTITSTGFGQYVIGWGVHLSYENVNKLANYALELQESEKE